MAKDQPEQSRENDGVRSNNNLVVAETLRSVSACKEEAEIKSAAKGEEKISVFWRVFGGTLLSIAALVVMTVYSSFSNSITELRNGLNGEVEKRGEFARKEDLLRGMTSQWSAIKEVQSSTGALGTMNDRVKVLDQQIERTTKCVDEDRKETRRKLEDQRKAGADDRTELIRQLDDQRKLLESKFHDVQRKLDDQRKSYDDERKELVRKMDEQRKTFDEERRDMLTRVQTMCERLATVEGQTSVLSTINAVKTPPSH